MMRSLRLLFRGRGSKGGSTERKARRTKRRTPSHRRPPARLQLLGPSGAIRRCRRGAGSRRGSGAGAPAAGLASTPDAAARLQLLRCLGRCGATGPAAAAGGATVPAMPPGGVPRRWSNRKPQPQPEDPPHPALPPGMPSHVEQPGKTGGAARTGRRRCSSRLGCPSQCGATAPRARAPPALEPNRQACSAVPSRTAAAPCTATPSCRPA